MRPCILEVNKGTYCGYTLSFALFACMNRHKMYLVALFTFGPPVYSWKYRSSGTLKMVGSPKTDQMEPIAYPTQLVPEDIDLVQEQNDGRPEKPSRIDHRIEKHERFSHPVLKDASPMRPR